jgi:hypothetical protein
MQADVTFLVAIGACAMLGSLATTCACVLMCQWAQRHGRDVELELHLWRPIRMRFRSVNGAERHTTTVTPPAHGSVHELAGKPNTPATSPPPAARDLHEHLERRQAA